MDVDPAAGAGTTLHMSGNSAGVLSEERIRDGELAFVQKPFTADELLAKVRAALDI